MFHTAFFTEKASFHILICVKFERKLFGECGIIRTSKHPNSSKLAYFHKKTVQA